MDKQRRDEILKVWDEALRRVARKFDDPTHDEMIAATEEVCAKIPGVTLEDIGAALRSSTKEIKADVARTTELLEQLQELTAAHNRDDDDEVTFRQYSEQEIHEVARAIENMCATSDSMALKEPDLDAMADIFHEQFGDLSPNQYDAVAAVFHERMERRKRTDGDPLPGLPGGPRIKR
jgi:hypothetical protein